MKHVILKPASKKGQQIMMRKRQEISNDCDQTKEEQLQKIHKKAFYEEKWFWFCLVIIVMCLTRPIKVIICGNCNGSGNDSANSNQCHI